MKAAVIWKNEMEFYGRTGEHTIQMDAKSPIGKDKAPTPKDLVAIGLGGCTAMDVIALLKKYKQPPKTFCVEIDVQSSVGKPPIIFDKTLLSFIVEGQVDPEKLIEAVNLSQTKYCGVSAMLSKSIPIEFRIVLNGSEIGTGTAKFE